MTATQASRITGLEIREIDGEYGRHVCYGAFEADGTEIARADSLHPKDALNRLVGILYQRTSYRVMHEQGFRCFSCGRLVPLQIDHIKKRSHGRDDTRLNLRAVGPECHELRHGKNAELKPHPKVLEAVKRHAGLIWHDGGWRER